MDTKRELKQDPLGTDHQEKYGEGKGGGRIKAKYQKKNMKGKILRKKKFVHSEKPKKDSCISLPKDLQKS